MVGAGSVPTDQYVCILSPHINGHMNQSLSRFGKGNTMSDSVYRRSRGTMTNYRAVDADGHVMEHPGEIKEFLEPPYDRLPWTVSLEAFRVLLRTTIWMLHAG